MLVYIAVCNICMRIPQLHYIKKLESYSAQQKENLLLSWNNKLTTLTSIFVINLWNLPIFWPTGVEKGFPTPKNDIFVK